MPSQSPISGILSPVRLRVIPPSLLPAHPS
ncbi:hypothetical protein CCHR01_03213 [Colletotrichum chrysophilum]|uniref:Uncharacterized protein n=1 Tax=Colletotrichum chrysophilum TaxID=1836956 RepID=A0AAD9EMM2_9PEZI|nr:hypothetical protein CCHR01_03213 [Colletotrichum chrysophilum]